MKKILAITAVCCLMLSSAVFAENEKGFINANASINKEMTPDTVEVSIAVVTDDLKSLQDATQQNKELSEKLYNAMNEMITDANGDYVKTSDFSAQPVYHYVNGKKNFEKYQVSNRIIVHTKSVDKVGEIIDRAIALGATNIDNLSFTLSSYEEYCDELLIKAAQKSRVRAENLAKAAGSQIKGVKSLNGSCNTSGVNQRIMYNMVAKSEMMDSAPAMGSVPISSGSVKLYANVNASYFVK